MKKLKRIMAFMLTLSFSFQSCLIGGIPVMAKEGEEGDKNGTVIVQYLEEGTDKVLLQEYEETGEEGEAYKGPDGDGNLSHVSIDGYDFVKTQKPEDLAAGEDGDPIWDDDTCNSRFLAGKTQIITHYYESNQGSIKIRFVDADTKEEIPAKDSDAWTSYQETGKDGDAYKGKNHDGYMGKVSIPEYVYYQTKKPNKIATDEEGKPIWEEDTCNSVFIKGEEQIITHEYVKRDTTVTHHLDFSKNSVGNGCDITLTADMNYLGNVDADSIKMEISIPKEMKARNLKIPAAKEAEGVQLKISYVKEGETVVLRKEHDATKPLEISIPSKASKLTFQYSGSIKNAGFYREEQSKAFSVTQIEILGQAIYEGKKELKEENATSMVFVTKDGQEDKKGEETSTFQIFAPSSTTMELFAPDYVHRYDQTHVDFGDITYHGPAIPAFQVRISFSDADVISVDLPSVEETKTIDAKIRTNQRTLSYEGLKGGGTLDLKRRLAAGEKVTDIILEFQHMKSLTTTKRGSVTFRPSYHSMKDGDKAVIKAFTRAYTTKEGYDREPYYRSSENADAKVKVSSAKIAGASLSMPDKVLRGEDFVLTMGGFLNMSTAHVDGMQSTVKFGAPVVVESFEKGESGQSDGTTYEYYDGTWKIYDGGKVKTTGLRITAVNPAKGFYVEPKLTLRQAEEETDAIEATVTSSVYDNKKTYMEERANAKIHFYDMEGTFSFSQGKDTLVSGETRQTYRMAFHKDDHPSAFSQVKIKVSLDEKFLAETLDLGTWSGYNGPLNVICRMKDGSEKKIGTYHKGDRVSLKNYSETLKEIQIRTGGNLGNESYAENITITGTTQKRPKSQKVLATATFDAVYGPYQKKIHDEKSLESKVYYYTITVPVMKIKRDELYYGDQTIITLGNVATLGNCSAKKLDASILLPQKVSVEKILLPSFQDSSNVKLVFVFDNRLSKTVAVNDDHYIPNKTMKKYIREIHFVKDQAPGGTKMEKGVTVAIKNESKVKRAFLSNASLKAEFGNGLEISKKSDIYNVKLLAKKEDMVVNNDQVQKVQEIEDASGADDRPTNNLPYLLGAIGLCSIGGGIVYWLRKRRKENHKEINPS